MITAETVKELRDRTGAGMMDCKRALSDAAGDMEKAIDALRKSGLVKAAKKASRAAAEGLLGNIETNDHSILVDVTCETDFVCKTDDFRNFVKKITDHVAAAKPADMDALLASNFEGKTVQDTLTELVAKIGENIGIRRFVVKNTQGIKAATYIHAGSKIGVIVTFDDPNNKLTNEVARDVAMHVAAMNPVAIRKSDVPADVIEREKEVFIGQMANEKKPAEVMAKIIEGKINKYLADICLEDQIFVRDTTGKLTVASMLKALDGSIKIREIVRYQVGEGIEKKKD